MHSVPSTSTVQHERGPRNSTLRRQMAYYYVDPALPPTDVGMPPPPPLDLVVNKPPTAAPTDPTNMLPPPLPQPVPIPAAPMVPIYNPYGPLYNGISPWPAPPPVVLRVPTPPPISLPSMSPEALREAGAKIVFLNVNWARYVPGFEGLSLSDRTILLEESWKDLFVLGLTQLIEPISLRALIGPNHRMFNMVAVDEFQLILNDLYTIRPDGNEYSCFRAITLFNYNYLITQRTRQFEDLTAISAISSFYQFSLHQYELSVHPYDVSRLSNFMHILVKMKRVESNIIEDLFLRATIGHTSVEKLITEMYTTKRELQIF
ncbi:protein tailless-like isoform X1 [Colias croceus]|uniref:protein tailless-like isoform X1 n=1 Tax=Colias crocea TaxID=72248 RepID=UPI001E27FEEB|nr:protein tailless-like isoform X1 [Colias croceus]